VISTIGSAASSTITTLAPNGIGTIYGSNLATGAGLPQTSSLPTSLEGTSVSITDASGVQQPAPLFYVSPGQVNFLAPAALAAGAAKIAVTNGNGGQASGSAQIASVAPGVFVLNSGGLAAVIVLIVGSGGMPSFQNVYQLDASNNVIPLPIDLSAGQIYLELYGTGLRNARNVTVTIGGLSVPVLSAGAQGAYPGLDQVNVGPLPPSLAGKGQVNILLTADGQTANASNVTIQ